VPDFLRSGRGGYRPDALLWTEKRWARYQDLRPLREEMLFYI
jgi:hypothetical protein